MTNKELSEPITLSSLESLSTENREQLQTFSSWFNSIYRQSILSSNQENKEEQIYLLLNLKKSIKLAIAELSRSKKAYNFTCRVCDEVISIEPQDDFWKKFQDHEHLENTYIESIKNLNEYSPQRNQTKMTLKYEQVDNTEVSMEENLDFKKSKPSSIQQNNAKGITEGNSNLVDIDALSTQLQNTKIKQEKVPNGSISHSPNNVAKSKNDSDSDSSSSTNFKFNFQLKYHEIVENALYPSSLMQDVRKIDKLKEYSIQRANKRLAVCLLCPCEIGSTKSVSKRAIIDHVFGQRHLRFATNPANTNALVRYHDIFLNMDMPYQCHQVYFVPDIGNIKCILCKSFTKYNTVQEHILSEPHKSRVLQNFKKGTDFKLINNQVELYGITMEEVVKKEIKQNQEKVVKNDGNKNRDRSNSSTDKESITHNIIKAVDSTETGNILSQLPNRFKGHKPFLKMKGKHVVCSACNMNLIFNMDIIKNHLNTISHIQNSKYEVVHYRYFCEICNDKFTDEATWQRHHQNGPNRHATIGETRKSKVMEYECTTCCTVIFGDELSLARHYSVLAKKTIKKEILLPDQVKKIFANRECAKQFADNLAKEANEVIDDMETTTKCCSDIETLLESVFSGCKAYPFGSRISGLGNHDSDLDVFLDTGGMYEGEINQDPQEQVQFVKKAEKVFRKNKNVVQDVYCIPTARTPIIKLFHVETGLDCDISFRHGLSVENTKFLRYAMTLQPVTQTLILVLKQWSFYSKLNEHITTYALAMMVIFYMQTKQYLPSVKKIREMNKGPITIIDGWETINYNAPIEEMKKIVPPCTEHIVDLLIDFFTYLYNFDYNSLVICPLMGRTISKKFFTENNGEFLPNEMQPYKDKQKSVNSEQFRALPPICIQDPFDLSHNLTKACQVGTLNKFKSLCDLTVKHLSNI